MTPERTTASKSVPDDELQALADMTEPLSDHGLTAHQSADGAEELMVAVEHQPAFISEEGT